MIKPVHIIYGLLLTGIVLCGALDSIEAETYLFTVWSAKAKLLHGNGYAVARSVLRTLPCKSFAFALHIKTVNKYAETNNRTTVSGWREVKVEGPSPRWVYVAAYDPDGNRVILFGGTDESFQPYGDLWEFSLETETWQPIEQSGMVPSPRYGAGTIADRARRRMVLFGGYAGRPSNEVWAFSFDTDRWSRLPDGPPARFEFSMTAGQDKAWIYGGYNNYQELQALGDLWELDLLTDTWRPLPAGPRSPAPRTSAPIGFDAASNKLYVFGGHARLAFTDVWSYDLTTESWTPVSPAGPFPDAVAHQAYSFDPDCQALFMMGGDYYDDRTVSSTWALKTNPATFVRIKSDQEPPRRGHAVMLMDATGRLILFGGATNSDEMLSDTWIFERDKDEE